MLKKINSDIFRKISWIKKNNFVKIVNLNIYLFCKIVKNLFLNNLFLKIISFTEKI